jgi:tRNA dimethylallyltransferase
LTGKSPLIVILGPTAVGKTSLALSLAQALNGEIVNADSRQVYRYMDIGTAKPNPAQLAQVPHHLIDILDPDETLSLAQYQALAGAAIADIYQRGRLPLLVGGTGQYITGFIEGWTAPAVAPNPALRADLEAFAAAHGAAALHARLRQHDPAAADSIDYRNVRRVVRALEVCLETGQPFSQQQRKHPPPYALRQYGLTMARDRLYAHADQRLDDMLARGFVDEVRHLLDMGYNRALPALSALGYAQLAEHLTGGVALDEALVMVRRATRAFIRRQYTWFRGHDTGIIWLEAEQLDTAALIQSTADWLREQTG